MNDPTDDGQLGAIRIEACDPVPGAAPVTGALTGAPEERALEKDARLRRFILRIERLEEEIASLRNDVREVYDEAKGTGYETKYMRLIVRLRKMEPDQRDEQDHLVDLYRKACGIGRRGAAQPAEGGKDGDEK